MPGVSDPVIVPAIDTYGEQKNVVACYPWETLLSRRFRVFRAFCGGGVAVWLVQQRQLHPLVVYSCQPWENILHRNSQ